MNRLRKNKTIQEKNIPSTRASAEFFRPILSHNIYSGTNDQFFKPGTIQRKYTACDKQIHRKENSDAKTQDSNELDSYISSLSSSGQPLPESSRHFFEPRFGQDFSQVKIHTDPVAAKSARSINALAYTTGNNIIFNQGQYSPNSESGQKLMAHELTHVVQQNTSPGLIQRFEGWEHQDLGKTQGLDDYLKTPEGKEWAKKYGYDPSKLTTSIENDPFYNNPTIKTKNALITPSEAISLMGDFYKTWQDLWNAPAQEIGNARNRTAKDKSTGILDTMDKERNHSISTATATNEYQKATQGRYLDLAKDNHAHFSPDNRNEWSRIHKDAIAKAKEQPHNNDVRDMAVLIDSAGSHFLTDAFAAGHLIDKEKILKEISLYLINHPIPSTNPEMSTIIAASGSSAAQLVLKIIHDHFNTVGFDVTNKKGMKWRTYGDDSLNKSLETQRIASLTVFLSRKQVLDMFNNISSDENEVLDLLPSVANLDAANQAAIAYIPEAIGQVSSTILNSRFAAPAVFGPVAGPFAVNLLNGIEDRANGMKSPFPVGPAFSLSSKDKLQIGAGVGVTSSPDDERSGVQAGGFLRGSF